MEDRGRVDKSEDVVVIVRPNMLTTNSARRWNRFAERVKEKDKRAIRISKDGEFIRALFSEKPASPAPEGEKAAETATEKEEKMRPEEGHATNKKCSNCGERTDPGAPCVVYEDTRVHCISRGYCDWKKKSTTPG